MSLIYVGAKAKEGLSFKNYGVSFNPLAILMSLVVAILTWAIAYGVLKGIRLGWLPQEPYQKMGALSARAVLDQIDETGAVQGVSGGTGMGHSLQHYKDIIVTPTAYGQGLTFLMLTELMGQDTRPD